jgi:hypothetical protein
VNHFTAEVNSERFTSRAASVYKCFVADVSCFGNRLFGIAFGDLFLFHNDQINQFIDGDAEYEVPVFLYNTPNALSAGGLLGFADDNWRDGTQSYVFGFLAPLLRAAGYGFTSTTIHEVGHHLGISHPHDGYDTESERYFVGMLARALATQVAADLEEKMVLLSGPRQSGKTTLAQSILGQQHRSVASRSRPGEDESVSTARACSQRRR